MANPKHLEILKQGVKAWNWWRGECSGVKPDLKGSDLRGWELGDVDLSEASLNEACIDEATLALANMYMADLRSAKLVGTNLEHSDISEADLSDADLSRSDLREADLRAGVWVRTNLSGATLFHANLSESDLSHGRFYSTRFGGTYLGGTTLLDATGLESCVHWGPSYIDHQALVKSGLLPSEFLRGCGLTDNYIEYLPSLLGQPAEFFSCFISYSHEDKPFAQRLHDQLQGHGIRCWLDEHQMLPGDDPHERIDQGIRLWDKTLLCCSRHSLTSWWVDDEITRTFAKEQRLTRERGRKVLALIPLDLDGYLFSDDCTNPKADEIRSRIVADFTGWETDATKFEAGLEKLVAALRADDGAREKPPEPRL